ncbi:hypothetical protein ACLMJK_006290 [Lecanora helva]
MDRSRLTSKLEHLQSRLKPRRSKSPLFHPRSPSKESPLSSSAVEPVSHLGGTWDDAFNEAIKSAGYDNFSDEIQQMRDANAKNASNPRHNTPSNAASPQVIVCKEVLDLVQEQEKRSQEKSWHLSGAGSLDVRKCFGQIASSVQKFVAVGDVLAQVDPVHVGLPWAAIRMTLILATKDHEKGALILQKLPKISDLIFRYSIFEECYLRGSRPVEGESRSGLTKVLKNLYKVILLFLLKAHGYLAQSTTKRLLKATISLHDLEQLSNDIVEFENEIQRYELLELKKLANEQFLSFRALLGAYDDHLKEEQREQIMNWISTTDYRSHHLDIYNRLLNGTANWLFDKDEYIQWRNSGSLVSSLLWLRGDVSSILNRLENEPRLSSRQALAYFYCSRTSGHAERGDPIAILKTILLQLSCPMRGLPLKSSIVNKYNGEKALGSQQASFNLKECQDMIIELLQKSYDHVTIVIDALDEVDEQNRGRLFKFLELISQPGRTAVKILVSSRNEPDIADYLERLENIRIDAENNAADIKIYIEENIEERLLLGKATRDLREKVKATLNSKANGMSVDSNRKTMIMAFRFRWVELQINSLCDPDYIHLPEDVEQALRKLPRTLEETYMETLDKFDRYSDVSKMYIKSLLKWLMVAEENLDVQEVVGAITATLSRSSYPWDTDKLVKMSLSFVTIDDESRMFKFAHLSVREFLEHEREYTGQSAHALAAELCLTSHLVNREETVSHGQYKFDNYSIFFWARHCRDAAMQRTHGKLNVKLAEFLGLTGNIMAFVRWNRAWYESRFRSMPGKIFWDQIDTVSFPAQPLFVASSFGFFELIDALLVPGFRLLEMKNTNGRTCLEVAARHGQTHVLRKFFDSQLVQSDFGDCGRSLLVAAARGSITGLKLVLDKVHPTSLGDETFVSAAQNAIAVVDMLQVLLDRFPDHKVTNTLVECVARETNSPAALSLLIQRIDGFRVTEAMLIAAAENCLTQASVSGDANDNTSLEILYMLLAYLESEEDVITKNVVIAVVENAYRAGDYLETVSKLIDNPLCCSVSHGVINAAASSRAESGFAILKVLLDRSKSLEMTEKILTTAAWNHLFDACPGLQIDEETLCIAAMNDEFGYVKLLLDRNPRIEITRKLFRKVARSGSICTMEFLLQCPRLFTLDPELLDLACDHPFVGPEMVSLLLGVTLIEKPFDNSIECAARSSLGSTILQELVHHFGSIPVSSLSLEAAAQNNYEAKAILEILLRESRGAEVKPEVVLAAAQQDCEVLELLFSFSKSVKLTGGMIEKASSSCDSESLKLLLAQDQNLVITQEILEIFALHGTLTNFKVVLEQCKEACDLPKLLTIAANNTLDGFAITQKLRESLVISGTEETMTLIKAVAANERVGLESLEAICTGSESRIPLDEECLKIAASNECEGKKILDFILTYSPNLKVTQETLVAAAANRHSGREIMAFLLNEKSDIWITEEFLEAVASNTCCGDQILSLVLAKPMSFENICVSEKVLQAMVRNLENGYELLTILMSKFNKPGMMNITDTVLEAAARHNDSIWREYHSPKHIWVVTCAVRSILKLLMAHSSSKVTTGLLQVAVANEICGRQLAEDIMKHPKNTSQIEDSVMEAAASNTKSGDSIVRFFLTRSSNVPVNEKVISAASLNTGCGNEVLQLLLEAKIIDHTTYGVRDALFHVAYKGNLVAVHALVEFGADIQEGAEPIGNALHIAAFNGQFQCVKLLLQLGADVNAPGGPHGSALLAACHQSHITLARFLVDAGAEVEGPDFMGRTALHRYIQKEDAAAFDTLLAIGASVSKVDKQKRSAIHHAASVGFVHGVRKLLDAGSSTSSRDSHEWTALHWAARHGSNQVVEALLGAGADKDSIDSQSRTPLDIAFLYGKDRLRHSLWYTSKAMNPIHGIQLDCKCSSCDMVQRMQELSLV